LKKRGWCGHLYSLTTVASPPLTLVQWQESATGTHTLATTLWWLAYNYRSKSIYLYSPYFFWNFCCDLSFAANLGSACKNLGGLGPLVWAGLLLVQIDIKLIWKWHQKLDKLSFTSNPYQRFQTYQNHIKKFWHHFDRNFFDQTLIFDRFIDILLHQTRVKFLNPINNISNVWSGDRLKVSSRGLMIERIFSLGIFTCIARCR
jgi:hypothetical protein